MSSAARNVNRMLHAVGTESPEADFFGHPFTHPLSEPYFSQAPIRFGEFVAFRPAHSLAAHRPLGPVMRARLKVYEALAAFRHQRNGVAPQEPKTVSDIPN